MSFDMTDVTPRVERRGGKRFGPPKLALCGHLVEWFPGPYKKQCPECAEAEFLPCAWCGGRCERRNAKFCSDSCRRIGSGVDLIGPRYSRICALEECDVWFFPNRRGVRCCSERHGQRLYNRESRADGRQVNEWNDRRRNNAQARRARHAGRFAKSAVYLAVLLERDGAACGICGELIDMTLKYPDPMSRSVDHVVPLARGGDHAPENCQLAHLTCNVKKGAKAA